MHRHFAGHIDTVKALLNAEVGEKLLDSRLGQSSSNFGCPDS